MKYLIYSSIIGSYDSKILSKDQISNQEYLNNFDFILYTNMKKLKSNLWKIIQIDESQYIFKNGKLDEPRTSYWFKTNPHLLNELRDYSMSVWVDSSITDLNLKELYKHCEDLEKSHFSLAIEKHPGRNCVYQELEACIRLNKDDPNEMINHVEQYRKEGMPSNYGLVETGFMIRKHHDKELIKFQEFLWNQMLTKSRRDQLSFNYCTWKLNFKNYKLFTFEDKCKVLHFVDHSNSPSRKEKVLLCGPYQGEIGFELFCFNGYLRYLSQNEAFDKIVIGTEPENKFLYDDFADQIIMSPSVGVKSRWQLNGKDPFFKIQNTQDKDIRLVRPNEELSYNLLANLDKQELISYNFTEEFKKKYPNLNFDEINEALRTKNIPNYLRKQLNIPLKNEFKIVVVGGNCEKYVERCLSSIVNQSNTNWKCCVSITKSNDKTVQIAKKFESDKIKVVETPKDYYVIQNYLNALENLQPKDDDIIIFIDLDDFLANDQVFGTIDAEYLKKQNLLMTTGSWEVWPEHVNIFNNSLAYTREDFQRGIRKVPFKGTHLRTIKYKVVKNINQNEFKHSKTGEIYKAASDVSFFSSCLESVGFDNYSFISKVLYKYNRENENNEDKIKKQESIDNTIDVSLKPIVSVKNFDKYRKISLRDSSFSGPFAGNGKLKNFDSMIEWDKNNLNRDVIFFTDFHINEVNKFSNKEKYAILLEPECIFPDTYKQIRNINNQFKYVFTHNKDLLDLGQNYRIYNWGGTWIEQKDWKIFEKSKDISFIVSKQNRTLGHQKRHRIVSDFKNCFDLFGNGYNPIDYKLDALKSYKFHIVVENTFGHYNYFSEKLIDSFLTGSIPIYSGAINLKSFGFDESGILDFNTLTELDIILNDIKFGKIKYEKFEKQIKHNFENAKKYAVIENYLYKNYFESEKL